MRSVKSSSKPSEASMSPTKPETMQGKKGSAKKEGKRKVEADSGNFPAKRLTRRSSMYCKSSKSQGCSLIQEFDEIIQAARSDAIPKKAATKKDHTNILMTERSSPQSVQSILYSQPVIKLLDVCTPQRPNNVPRTTDSIAPSPITPPLPVRRVLSMSQETDDGGALSPQGMNHIALSCINHPLPVGVPSIKKEEKNDVAPSPQGTSLTPQSSGGSLHHITQSVARSKETNVESDQPFLDATLEIDSIIDEIWKKRSSSSDRELFSQDFSVSLSTSAGTLNFSLDCEKSDPIYTSQKDKKESGDPENFTPQATETDLLIDSQTSTRANEGETSKLSSDPEQISMREMRDQVNTARVSAHEEIVVPCTRTSNMDTIPFIIPPGINGDTSACVSQVQQSESNTNQNKSELNTVRGDSLLLASSDLLMNDEAFCEDLSLSASQILDIDAKCSLYTEVDRSASADPSQGGTAQNQNSGGKDPIPLPPANAPPQVLEFSVPSMPRLDWIQKVVDGRRRLQMITQEISRLNAMVLRARRTLWPRQQSTADISQLHVTQPIPFQPSTSLASSQIWSQDVQGDPEWNII